MKCDPVKAFGGACTIRKKTEELELPGSVVTYKMDKQELEKYGEPVITRQTLEYLIELGFTERRIATMYNIPTSAVLALGKGRRK